MLGRRITIKAMCFRLGKPNQRGQFSILAHFSLMQKKEEFGPYINSESVMMAVTDQNLHCGKRYMFTVTSDSAIEQCVFLQLPY